jgi:hypothetical protein
MERATEFPLTDNLVAATPLAEGREAQATLPDALPGGSRSLDNWEFEDLISRRESKQDTFKW